ncbi:hypothetical protein [Crenobacter cavernae]|uniref:DUF4148 domain-containing protein n=1 Tax=Crenobacter cavernae TaxID=2290923 RepID=A0A345Y2C0_9NEIS|nr:hypothetical protein [Crenobacter cavernae]AXK38072.1 hypothetical protein DWG20_00740 [Crenobacter cavernae]
MKKLVLTALSLSVLASAAFADGGDNARAFIERNAVHSQYVQQMATSAQRQEPASGLKVQAPSPEALSHYADHAIKNNPENYRSK